MAIYPISCVSASTPPAALTSMDPRSRAPSASRRRSPPAPRPSSPAPLPHSATASTSASSYRAAPHGSTPVARAPPARGPPAHDPTMGGLVDSPGRIDPGPSNAIEAAASSSGGYAYSTTLRRHVSTDVFPHFPHAARRRDSSPHVASPYSRGQHPLTGSPGERLQFAHRDEGLFERAMAAGRRLLGKKDYDERRMEEEEKRLSTERRQRETPSSIYAHKSVQVGPFAVSQVYETWLIQRAGNTGHLCHTSHRRPCQLGRRSPPRPLRAQRI